MTDAPCETQADEIYQGLLDRIKASYFANDFETYRTMIHTPHTYTTNGGTLRIVDEEQLALSFQAFREYLVGMGVTDFKRECIGAAVLNADKIIGGHSTEFLSGDVPTREPYEVWATVERINGVWVVTGSENAIEATSWQARAFQLGAEHVNVPVLRQHKK